MQQENGKSDFGLAQQSWRSNWLVQIKPKQFQYFTLNIFISELTSPNYPYDFDISDLECEWVVKARFGTKVKLTFVQADMGEDCELDSLNVYDSGSSTLEYPGLSSQCGENQFPPSYEKVISDGPVTVK